MGSSDGERPDGLPSDALYLGTDANGHGHYHSRSETAVVLALDGGGVLYTREDVPAGPAVGKWFDSVQERVGWRETDVAEVMADHLHHALRGAEV